MSRVGNNPIPLPDGVKAVIEEDRVRVEGPKGKLSTRITRGLRAELSEGRLIAHREDDEKDTRSRHGLFRALLANSVTGVSHGFEKRLDIVGVGYRAEVKGQFLHLSLGYSHPILVPVPDGIEIAVERGKKAISQYVATLSIKGIDRCAVGQLAADIRALRKPDVYKGKGIRYEDESIKIKVGKKGA